MMSPTFDAMLASLHHLLVLCLAGTLTAQWVLLGLVPDGERLRQLGRLVTAQGVLTAILLLAAAVPLESAARANPFLWFKLGAFGVYVLLAVVPARQVRRWQRQTALPDAAVIYDLRAWVTAQLALLGLMAMLAAWMARLPSP
jgi:uncharacterized membrane protein